MVSKGKQTHLEENIDVDTGTRMYWKILCLFVFLAVGLNVVVSVLSSWRIAEPINYTYVYRDKKQTRRFGEVLYGLYKINFDGGSYIVTWNKRVAASKASLLSIPGAGTSAGGMMHAKLCPAECESGIKTRYTAYKRIKVISVALLVVLLVCDVLAVAGVALFFFLKDYPLVYLSLWGAAGAISLGTGGYWIWETNDAFWLISSTQQIKASLHNPNIYPEMPMGPYASQPINMQMGLYPHLGVPPQNLYLRSNPSAMPVMNNVSMMGKGVPPSRNLHMPIMPYMMPGGQHLPPMMPGDHHLRHMMLGNHHLPHMMPSDHHLNHMIAKKASMPLAQTGFRQNIHF